jgi:hypothetical protein
LYLLGRRFGRLTGLAAGVTGAALLAGATSATAEKQAVATALLSLAVTAAVVGRGRTLSGWWLFPAGLLGGCALLFRLELAPAVILSVLPLLLLRKRDGIAPYGAGLVVALLPYVPIGIVVGSGKLHQNFEDLRQTGRDRRLPVPGLTSDGGRLLALSLAGTALLLAVGFWQTRARRVDPNARLLLGAGLFSLVMAPFAFWRADPAHIIAAGTVPLSFLPIVAASLYGLQPKHRTKLVGGVTALVLLFFLSTHAVRGNLNRNLQLALGEKTGSGYRVSYGGRYFILASKSAAHDVQKMVDLVGAQATPGQRLFVGPRDLRRTNQNDVFVYYLLPRLKPASFYVELDPPVSRRGSPLPDELRRADYLILTTRWDRWNEPNGSRRFGSSAANQVVQAHFCLTDQVGTYALFKRCR